MMPDEPNTTRVRVLGCICGFLPLALGVIGFGAAMRHIPGDYEGANAVVQGFWIVLVALLIYYLEVLFMSVCYASSDPHVSAFSRGLFPGLFVSYLGGLLFIPYIVGSSSYACYGTWLLILGALGLIRPIISYARTLRSSKGTRR